ncbi:MAG: class I SAM-dependent methyltransferase [Actinobacteria bacterium]|nr:class I SAM-dependent methyltransferase [Actinomycetota bacterium]
MNREELRATFEEVPELYDRARPLYPPQVFDDLVGFARLPEGGRILEIGPGTGQATRPLAERGYSIVAVELGEQLAEVARRNLASFPNVEIVRGNFETWEPEATGFDAVVAFTAFHWIDPESRFVKVARLLRPGGALAIVETQHVLPTGSDSFWVEVQDDYDAVVPDPDNRPPPPPEEVFDLSKAIEASGLFEPATVRRYIWEVTYAVDDYLAVLDTYSGHRSMKEDERLELYRRIRRRIEARPEERVTKSYLAILNAARRQ